MKSSTSLDDVPDELMHFHIVTFIGPKDLLPSLGSASKEYRTLATGEAVWTVFCKQRGAENSKVYKKVVEYSKKNPRFHHEARQRKFATLVERFEQSTTMSQYKVLRRSMYHWRNVCGWCNFSESACPSSGCVVQCALCEKTACLDCINIVGLPGSALRNCVRCERRCCHGCARKIVEHSHEDIRAVPLTSIKDYSETNDKDPICTKCKKKEIAWREKMSWEYEAFVL